MVRRVVLRFLTFGLVFCYAVPWQLHISHCVMWHHVLVIIVIVNFVTVVMAIVRECYC